MHDIYVLVHRTKVDRRTIPLRHIVQFAQTGRPWHAIFDNKKLAEEIAAKARNAYCRKCKLKPACTQAQVITRNKYWHPFSVEAFSSDNIYTKDSGAACTDPSNTHS